MGQLPPMIEMFKSLGIGLAVAVFVILVLLTAYFQSPRLALISIGAVPGVLAGIAIILYFTNTSLNIESFMGSIMCLGVSVSNSVMLVTFMDEHWKAGKPSTEAAIDRRQRAAAADPDDGLRDDRRHGADGAGPGAGEPDAGPARPGGDRRAGDVDVRHLAGRPVDLRGRDRQEGGRLAVDPPGRPREPVLQSRKSSPTTARLTRIARTNHTEGDADNGGRGVGARHLPRPEVPDAPSSFAHGFGSRRRRPPARALAHGRPRRAGLPPRARDRIPGDAKPPTVRLIQPRARNIVRVVGQPSFIESYERTSIYPKPTAYIEKWIVDIGDKVKKGDVLATLFVPELVEELGTKKAAVVLDRERIALAKEVVEVAKADVEAAEARLDEAEAILDKFEAEVDRWDTEVKRLERQVARVVVNPRVLFESTNQLKSSIAARDKAKATIKRAKAELLAARARLGKAEVDVRVAEAT